MCIRDRVSLDSKALRIPKDTTLLEYSAGQSRDYARDFSFCKGKNFALVRIEDPFILKTDWNYKQLKRFLEIVFPLMASCPAKIELRTRVSEEPEDVYKRQPEELAALSDEMTDAAKLTREELRALLQRRLDRLRQERRKLSDKLQELDPSAEGYGALMNYLEKDSQKHREIEAQLAQLQKRQKMCIRDRN